MRTDVAEQIRDYAEYVDSMVPTWTAEDLVTVRVDQPQRPFHAMRRLYRPLLVSIAAAVFALVVIGGTAWLIGGGDVTEQETTTVPATTTVPPTTVPPMVVESWQRVGTDVMEPIAGLYDITTAGERLVAVGDDAGEDGRPDGVILVSDDGFTWTRVAEDDEALTTGAVLMYAITEGGPGLVAVGGGCDDPEEACPLRATVWTSVDGTAWTRIPYDTAVFGAVSSVMEEVVVTEHGIVAVGRNEGLGDEGVTMRPAVWVSPDGIEWARTWEGEELTRGLPANDPPETGAFVLSPMQAVTVGPDGTLVAVGTVVDDSGVGVAAVWTSSDGQTWERVPHDPAVFASSEMDVVMFDVAAGESGLVAVGSERNHQGAGLWWTGGERPAVWTSADGTAWERITLDDEAFRTPRSISTVAASPTGFVAAGPIFADTGPVTMWGSADGTSWQAVAIFGAGYATSVIEAGPAMTAAGGVSHAAVWAGPPFDPNTPPLEPLPPPEEEVPPPEEEVPPPEEEVSAVLSCDELATRGLPFAKAVAYWMRHGMPAELDTDGNGVPCEAEYPVSDITAVYGGPEAMSVHIISDLPALFFVATGPAVDAGIICPTGTTEFTDDSIPPTHDDALVRWSDIYTCDDGSGTFTIGADVMLRAADSEYGVWSITSGTGMYEYLAGGGGSDTSPTGPGTWSDNMPGRLTSGTAEE